MSFMKLGFKKKVSDFNSTESIQSFAQHNNTPLNECISKFQSTNTSEFQLPSLKSNQSDKILQKELIESITSTKVTKINTYPNGFDSIHTILIHTLQNTT